MDLKLDRPVCFFDLETTGVNVSNDRIVEISIIKINIDKNILIITLSHCTICVSRFKLLDFI